MRPHVVLNCAMSLDGFIGKPDKRIRLSNQMDKERVHKIRASIDGIMVGVNTILADNPHLTVRHAKGRNPVRIVVDSMARTPLKSNVFDGRAKTLVAVSNKASSARKKKIQDKAEVLVSGTSRVDLKRLMKLLYCKKIKTLLLEGGGTLNKSMLENNLVDEIYLTITPVLLGEGIRWINDSLGKKISLTYAGCKTLGDQIVLHYHLK